MPILREERWYSMLETMHISGQRLFEVFEGLELEESLPALLDLFKSWKDEEK
jgi:hypothetical protein